MKAIVMILALLAGAAQAGDGTAEMMVKEVRAAASIGAAKAGAGFFVLMNHGGADDRLLAVEADFPRVELHTTEMKDGLATMVRQDDGVVIPAGGMVRFAPGGLHVMFMGLSSPFVAGESFEAVAVFERAGRIPLTFEVVDRSELAGSEMGHGGHGSN